MQAGINIWSGAQPLHAHDGTVISYSLGARLTNQTGNAMTKGNLDQPYRVVFRGKRYIDAEAALKSIPRPETLEERILQCTEVIAEKLRQHPELTVMITEAGGVDWLASCTHETWAKTERFQRWEGYGVTSPFLRALIAAYQFVTLPQD